MRITPYPEKSHAAALIIVLGFLVVILILTVSVLRRAGTERASVGVAESTSAATTLAETAVSLAKAQIQLGSTAPNSTWTSQPGMVRAFGPGGALIRAYKLYSASSMSTTTVDIAEDVPPASWSSLGGQWVDLNQPRTIGSETIYPILDPGVTGSLTSAAINGFAVNSAPGPTTAQPVPMPVRWLYLLADGKLIAPTGGSDDSATFGPVDAPTAANPITGRIAFWTDDETCKVNVNTASFPTYFDTPRFQSTQDRDYADKQPAQREYQRFPGHPATTSLAAVFINPTLSAANTFEITPKIARGGSEEGTRQTNPFGGGGATAVTLDTDRLYASGGEILFRPTLAGAERQISSGLTEEMMQKAKFFVTGNSRAPEVNPFGLPKIATWPIHRNDTNATRTAYDRLIALCSTLKIRAADGTVTNYPYYFQREDSRSATNDWTGIARNQRLYSYLQTLTDAPMPGADGGGALAGKFGADRDQFLTQIMDYIRSTNLYDDSLAASGGTPFTSGRTGTNNTTMLPGHGWVTPLRVNNTQGFGRFFTLSEVALQFICTGDPDNAASNKVSPDPEANRTLAAGTPLTGTGATRQRRVQMAILFELFSVMQGYTQLSPELTIQVSGLTALQLNSQSLFPSDVETLISNSERPEGVNPVGGHGGYRYNLQAALVNATDRKRRAPARGPILADSGINAENSYPFISNPVTVSGAAMAFSGGVLTIRLYGGTAATGDPVQVFTVNLPAGDLPVPNLAPATSDQIVSNTAANWWGFHADGGIQGSKGRLWFLPMASAGEPSSRAGAFVRDTDVVRSVMVSHGDHRLVQGRAASSDLTPFGNWFGSSVLLHTLREAVPNRNTIAGTLSNSAPYKTGLNYGNDTGPDFQSGATPAPDTTGDFDTGVGGFPDGAFINKPDEGSTHRPTATDLPYFNRLETQTPPGPTFFSPSRIMPSPGMFGSLPTHVQRNVPWRTLLLRPQNGHPNNVPGQPKDHTWMELFWMPVVEPYAISEPFSTDGKVNLNYQILPFTYITRSTAIRSVLASEFVPAVQDSAAGTYKRGANAGTNPSFRIAVDQDATLAQFQTRFTAGNVFKLTSELCDVHIVPTGQTAATMDTFWTSRFLTGDNLRERPYTTIYPRVTVRSNVFTVHYRVQSLRKVPSSAANVWDGSKDRVESEAFGQVTIERYLDPNGIALSQDYAVSSNPLSLPRLADFYRWRTIRSQLFAP